MDWQSLELIITKLNQQINDYWTSIEPERGSRADIIASLVSELQKRYGELFGELRIKYPDKIQILNENSQKEDTSFQEYKGQNLPDPKVLIVSRMLRHASELISMAKTLESETKKEKTDLGAINTRLNDFEDRIKRLENLKEN